MSQRRGNSRQRAHLSPTSTAEAESAAGDDRWDGATLHAALAAGADRLSAHRQAVDDLNVFPVPDGDTGSNMSLTLRAAVDAGKELAAAGRSAGEVAAAVAHGALLGARGNSGVILSQILRGFSDALVGRTEVEGRDLARALDLARETAYKAVIRPVEGTLLTVIRGAADRAARLHAPTPSACLAAALAGAEAALAETPSLLPILRQAGVVDAGGQGLVHFLAGMVARSAGEESAGSAHGLSSEETDAPAVPAGDELEFLDHLDQQHANDGFGYCTNFLIHFSANDDVSVERCRHELAAMGDSAVIVGDDRVLKVHLHTRNPGAALEYGLALGDLDQIKIDNMERQTAALRARRNDARSLHTGPATSLAPPEAEPVGVAVLAVTVGAGLTEALRSMGATIFVEGGQTMNPSVQDLLSAVESAVPRDILILPNNPNVILTANQIPALTRKRVAVVPSRSVPQGLAALTSFSPDDPLATNLEQMSAATATVRTVEITEASRDATIDGIAVAHGQTIGMVDGRLVASADDPLAVVRETLDQAGAATAELVTIFSGAGVPEGEAETLRADLGSRYPELAIEFHPGGQPHYRYVIAVEG